MLGTHKYLEYVQECLKHARRNVWHQKWPSVLDRLYHPRSSPTGTMLSRRTSLESYRTHVGPYKPLHGSWTYNTHIWHTGIRWKNDVMLMWHHISGYAHHGSNSCIILSNRMTANNRAENPDTHAKKRMANVMRLFHPAGFVSNVFILTLECAGRSKITWIVCVTPTNWTCTNITGASPPLSLILI